MKNKTIIGLLALSILSASPATFAKRNVGSKAISVVTEPVAIHQVSQSLSLVGKLEADQSVIIASEVNGIVDEIKVTANQKVEKGQPLVLLNDDKARAAVAEAKAYTRDQKRILAEFERLVDRNAITKTEIDAQKAAVEIGNARLDAANANLNDLYIEAPFTGTVA